MDREQKSMLYRNIAKFIIGVVLLFISYGYIQNHPAEKVSILSGFQVMYERGQVFVYELFGRDASTLKQKHRLAQYYQELIRVAESRTCVPPDLLSDIFETYRIFVSMETDELADSIGYYSLQATTFDAMIQEACL